MNLLLRYGNITDPTTARIALAIVVIGLIYRLIKKLTKKDETKIEDLMDAEFKEPSGQESSSFAEEENSEESNDTDFSEDFFIRAQKGEKSQYFLNVSSQQDCSIIRSLLHSAHIPTIADFTNLNSLYGSAAGVQNIVFSSRISILQDDYDEAVEIVGDYIKQKIDVLKLAEPKSEIVKTASALLSLFLAKPMQKSQEILGISIYPKVDENKNQQGFENR
ncbi:hypothetical protein [Treponema zioleckii]|uniref:hypothetical protein n=1 Tax=Treponema zioleckii TaxID=331680 RepID=UPI00168AB967|nr:hypothetical protein [Treponema zioleckii]